ncbi:hypothetical protein KCP73_11200 [Salmonella enterica subsp. enterica]|nr:hypothetical protein KCP73_11200 [Salmonella enterica subsp. enterica]
MTKSHRLAYHRQRICPRASRASATAHQQTDYVAPVRFRLPGAPVFMPHQPPGMEASSADAREIVIQLFPNVRR